MDGVQSTLILPPPDIQGGITHKVESTVDKISLGLLILKETHEMENSVGLVLPPST